MTKLRLKIPAILLAIVLSGYLVGMDHIVAHSKPADQGAGLKSEEKTVAPEFLLPDLSGGQVSLSDYRGKWVFLNFWATWCGPCVMEMPMMDKLNKNLEKENFKMLAINMEDIDPERIRKFVKNLKVDFHILLDRRSEVGAIYGVRSIPMTFLINPKGEVEAAAEGSREWDNPKMIHYFRELVKNPTDDEKAELGGTKPL